MPSALLTTLNARQKKSDSFLVFPAPKHPTRPDYGGDGVDAHMLEACKEIALRAGSQLRKMRGNLHRQAFSNKEGKSALLLQNRSALLTLVPSQMASTFASNMLPVLGLKKLQLVLGHKDISTTQKYLHLVGEDEVREKVEHSVLAAFV